MKILLAAVAALLIISGCAEMPLKDGELVVAKDTTAGMDDVGVAHISNKF